MKPSDPKEPDTLVGPDGEEATQARPPIVEADDATSMLKGYVFGEVIGRGGLGEVVIAHDLRVGRDVAIKRLHTGHPTADETARFLREARIQARLDHPAVLPVYDLGTDDAGRPFFTMKRLAGITLSELMASPMANRQRLLRAFADVCLAIEFAHSRGIVHRDLKPSNVMLGDFGDVYVLDWGLARVVGEAVAEVQHDDIDSLEIKEPDLLGTPGYMSPEQLHKAAEAGRPADIYALGAMLFEVLAGEPLHPRGPTALQSTVSGDVVTSAAKRRPDRTVPPELDAIVGVMVAMDPSARPTARKVAERVEAYLDGDRDIARRRTMAVDLVWSARAALNEGRSAEAMNASGRALALDPESTEAAELVSRVILTPPLEPPLELRAALDEHEHGAVRRHARGAIFAYLALAAFLPIAVWNGVLRWDIVIAVFGSALVMAGAAWRIYQKPNRSLTEMLVYAIANALLVIGMARLAGPFTFVPALACVVIMSSMAYPPFIVRPWLLVTIIGVGFLIPIFLELGGVVTRTWEVTNNELISHAGALKLEGLPTTTMLITSSLAMIVVAGTFAARFYRIGRDAQRQLVMHAWHLGHLLPASRPVKVSQPPPFNN
ncbi:MAG TPA: serine/threonine-protein kinase [Kofleriaceae bacterium]